MSTLTETDNSIRDWARGVLDGVDITADGPRRGGEPAPAARVSLYLLELGGERELQGGRHRNPLGVVLRYLVTADGPDRVEAHDLLGRLLDAATAADDITARLDPPAPEVWLALGAPPQPAFVLEATDRIERAQPDAPLVTEPLIVRGSVLRALHGRLLGPGDRGVSGATVALDGTATRVHTGRDGSFRLAAAPDTDGRARFRIVAKGREFVAEADLSDGDEDLVIHFDPRET
jgi:hypothetical protein